MFVRFRLQGNRLQASLVQSRRAAGKVRAEHVGALGSVDAEVSVRERVAFWAKLPGRLDALGNRHRRRRLSETIDAARNSRIPIITPDDIRAVQEESFEDDERLWDAMHSLNAAHIESHKAAIAHAEGEDRRDGAGRRESRRGG